MTELAANHLLGSSQRVYDADAVDGYVQSLRAERDRALQEAERSVQRAQSAEQRLEGFLGAEALLGRTLLLAQRAAGQTMARASQEAAELLAAAQAQAEAALSEAARRQADFSVSARHSIDDLLAARDERLLADIGQSHRRMLKAFDTVAAALGGAECGRTPCAAAPPKPAERTPG